MRKPLKVLVVEDQEALYNEEMLRFEGVLLLENFEFTHVKTASSALVALEKDWDVVLMDYWLSVDRDKRGWEHAQNGANLIVFRRALEKAEPERKKTYIIGFSGSVDGCAHMVTYGATCAFLKHDILVVATLLGTLLNELT